MVAEYNSEDEDAGDDKGDEEDEEEFVTKVRMNVYPLNFQNSLSARDHAQLFGGFQ